MSALSTHTDANGRTIDHRWAPGTVVVNADGTTMFSCGVPGCNSLTKNLRHNISTHISKKHKQDGQYLAKAMPAPRECGDCPARPDPSAYTAPNFLAYVTHIRRRHGHQGESEYLWQRYQELSDGETIEM
ncbi:hypothetical protein GGS26DRAFT_591274 [Hypomontagnella submonticulosa]|nr:hypothetical protein GGS26DRAFT_591274 [Hypomontagnella submonticulosa]